MTDCIGYIFAKQLGIKFLTGDKEFENLDNVEFVKWLPLLNFQNICEYSLPQICRVIQAHTFLS